MHLFQFFSLLWILQGHLTRILPLYVWLSNCDKTKKRREFSWISGQKKKIMLKTFIVYEIWLCSQMGTLAVFSTNIWNQFKVVYFDSKQSEQLTLWYMVHFPSHGSIWSVKTLVAFYAHDTSVFPVHLAHSLSGRFGKMSHPIKIFVCYVCADKKKTGTLR